MNLKMNVISRRNLASSGFRIARLAAVGLSLLVARSVQAGLIQTVEALGVQSSTASNTTVIDFNSASTGYHYTQSFVVSPALTVTYTGNQFINPADRYGGAVDPSNNGHSSNYFAVPSGDVTMTLSNAQAYFGIWISAADAFNQIAFYNGNTLVGSLTGTGAFLSALPSAYLGNPTPDFLGQDGPTTVQTPENFVFVNFYAQTAADEFNKIVLSNTPGSGTTFESDNHTFSTELQAPSAVPEPSSFALLGLGGLGLAISAYRRRCNLVA